jgi:Holliday junction resolvasome RuvABC DNA-binding subunit
VWQGEPNSEDRASLPPGLNEKVKADLAKEQEVLYQTLYTVLKREARSTIDTLIQVYGLGTEAPSKFGLALVSRMQFREACPAVMRSEQIAKQSSSASFLAARAELEATLHSLKCQ